MAELLTLKQIAQRLDLPPSTVRYYRDTFKDFMPAVDAGRYPKYSSEALQLVEDIKNLFQADYTRDQVREQLSKKYAVNQEDDSTTTTAITTAQQAEKALCLLDKHTDLLQEQQATIANQAALIARLNEQLAREQSVKERLFLKELTRKKKPAKEKPGPWWKKIL